MWPLASVSATLRSATPNPMSWREQHPREQAECEPCGRSSSRKDGARSSRPHMFECRKVPDERGARLVDLDRVAVDAALRYLDPLHRGGSGGTAARVALAVTLVAVQRGVAPALRPQYTAEWQRTLGDGCPRGRSQCRSSAFNSHRTIHRSTRLHTKIPAVAPHGGVCLLG